jgi:hypothetical protein
MPNMFDPKAKVMQEIKRLMYITAVKALLFATAPFSRTNTYSSLESVWFIFNLQKK